MILVGSDNGKFEWLDQQLRMVIGRMGGCVALSKSSSQGNSVNIIASIITSSPAATIIICDCYHYHFRLTAEALWENNVTRRVWILSTAFSYSPRCWDPWPWACWMAA